MAEPGDPNAPPLPLYFREYVVAQAVGFHAVRTRPLNGYEFNLWWLAHTRFQMIQTEDGRKEMRTRVGVAFTLATETGEPSVSHSAMVARYSRVMRDAARDRTQWTTPAAVLALLPDDDPRAIFLRHGGRLDAQGNPVLTAAQLAADHARRNALTPPIAPRWSGA